MGIINVTPDSFSGDGLARGDAPEVWAAAAAEQAVRQVAAGAGIIDVGGASSRPGSVPLEPAVEIARVIPAIRAIATRLPPHIPISVDTTSVSVARAALAAGATMLNDISGLHAEPAMAHLAAEAQVPLVLMANMRGHARYAMPADVVRHLARGLEVALAAGVAWDRLIIDPGFGFGHTPEQNVAILRHLDLLLALGRPILLGVSRKSTLGHLLGDALVEDRLEASLAAAVAGVLAGVEVVRAHDVLPTARALRIADAIAR